MGTPVVAITAEELEGWLDELGWSGARLARECYCHPNTVTRWRKGEFIPPYVRAVCEPRIKLRDLCLELGIRGR